MFQYAGLNIELNMRLNYFILFYHSLVEIFITFNNNPTLILNEYHMSFHLFYSHLSLKTRCKNAFCFVVVKWEAKELLREAQAQGLNST